MHFGMHKASTKVECCPQYDAFTGNVKCFEKDIRAEVNRMARRTARKLTKNKRLHRLAIPKNFTPIFVPQCPCKFKKPIEIIRLDNLPRMTRTEQLAYPVLRKILLFKTMFKHLFPPQRVEIINRLARLSLFSIYSHLANAHPPEKSIAIPKWTPKEWKVHIRYLKKLAKHKVPPPSPKLPVQRMDYDEMVRYKYLAKPKDRYEPVKEDWVFKPEHKNYEASERLQLLATPATRDDALHHQSLPVAVPPNALRYKATKRIVELATARDRGVVEADVKENPYAIAPNALKAKASARTKELAEPKEYENVHTRENPEAISPAALKAKASPRIIALAKPKER